METGRAALVHPVRLCPTRLPVLAEAALDVSKHFALTLAIVAGGTVALALVLMLVLVGAPVAGALIAWILWRSARDGARATRRFGERARRRARSLGLRVVRGAGA